MKTYGRRPTTVPGKRLSIAHLQQTDKLLVQKVRDHEKQAAQGVDIPYNKAHAKNHKKDHKDIQKYIKKVRKLKVKQAKK